MSFGAPIMLLGLLAMAVPIAVHLIHRRRAQRVRFPAMRLLLQSRQRVARGLRIKQWLLLALRVGLFALVPLAMAQPLVRCGGGTVAAGDDRLPASVAVVVDDSASVAVPLVGGDGWAEAVQAGELAIDGARSWDRLVVVFSGRGGESPMPDWSDDAGAALRALRERAPAGDASGLEGALAMAGELQATSTQPSRRTVVITDNAERAWAAVLADPARLAALGRVDVVELGGAERSNVGVTSLAWTEAPDGAPGEIEFEAVVEAWGRSPGEVSVTLEVGGLAVGTTVVEPAAGAPEVARFRHVLADPGDQPVRVVIDDGAGPRADDERWAMVRPRAAVHVVLVNGDARAVQYNDEVFFLSRALAAASDDEAAFAVETVVPEELGGVVLEGVDVVVLANVGALAAQQVERLRAWVEQGGGVLMTAGDQLDETRTNALFGALLPRSVRSVTELSRRDDRDASIKATRLAAVDGTHPIFRGFDRPGGESLQSALVYRYLLLEPSAESTARTLASWGDGGPALVERRLGEGGVLLWTSTIDYDWTDLPIRTTYLPLMRRIVEYLARRGGGGVGGAEVGSAYRLTVESAAATEVAVISPSGVRTVVDVQDGAAWWTPGERGAHAVRAVGAGTETPLPGPGFVANAPASESDVTRASAEGLASLVSGTRGDGAARQGGAVGGSGRPVWPTVLLLSLVLIYVESALSVRRRVWRRLSG